MCQRNTLRLGEARQWQALQSPGPACRMGTEGLPGPREAPGGYLLGAWVHAVPGRPAPTALAPSPTNDTKLVLSTSIQIPKQKIRLPRTFGEERRRWWWASGETKWGGVGRRRRGSGPRLDSRETTYEKEEVENEEEVLDEAEAAVLGRHRGLEG